MRAVMTRAGMMEWLSIFGVGCWGVAGGSLWGVLGRRIYCE